VPLEKPTGLVALDVDPGVVGHQPLRDDPVPGEVGERSFEEAGHGHGTLIGMDLGVGEPGVIVDDRMHVVDTGTLTSVLACAVAGDAVAGPLEARVLARVHVQQIAGAGPLVTNGRFPRRA